MPPHHPPLTRQRCVARARNGEAIEAIAADEGVPAGTISSWLNRAPAKKAPAKRGRPPKKAPTPNRAVDMLASHLATYADDFDEDDEASEAAEPDEDEELPEVGLVDLSRADYLAAQIERLDVVIEKCVSSKNFTAIRGLVAEQSSCHKERVDVLRAEGSRLDLTTDPRQLAAQIKAADTLLRTLLIDMEQPS